MVQQRDSTPQNSYSYKVWNRYSTQATHRFDWREILNLTPGEAYEVLEDKAYAWADRGLGNQRALFSILTDVYRAGIQYKAAFPDSQEEESNSVIERNRLMFQSTSFDGPPINRNYYETDMDVLLERNIGAAIEQLERDLVRSRGLPAKIILYQWNYEVHWHVYQYLDQLEQYFVWKSM